MTNKKSELNLNIWQKNYEDVCAYLLKHHCDLNDIPDSAVFRSGKNMKRWLYEMQKAYYNRESRYQLNAEQKLLLEDVAIDTLLSITDHDWYLHFHALLDFFQTNHHLKIPADAVCSDGRKLLGWTRLQRNRYQNGALPQKYIKEFEKNDLMMILETPLDTAMRHVEEYFKTHGNIDFETNYVAPDGYPLGTWLRTLRAKMSKN